MNIQTNTAQGAAKLAVEDHLEILQLYARYSHMIDSANAAGMAATFTPDGTWTSGGVHFKGADQLAAFARASYDLYGGYRHVQTNVLLEPDGDKVNGSSYLMFMIPVSGGPANVIATGRYRDTLVKLPEGWRFASREVIADEGVAVAEMSIAPNPEGRGGPSQKFKNFLAYLKITPPVVTLEALRAPAPLPPLSGIRLEQIKLGATPAYELKPDSLEPGRTILYFHGGGYVTGSPPNSYLNFAARLATVARSRVIVADYRLAPETRFPGAYDDGLEAYGALIAEGVNPKSFCLVGDSAGAGLAVAVALGAKKQNLALPIALGLISPFADMTLSGATIDDQSRDPFVKKELVAFMAKNYVDPGEARDWRCSPVFADLTGLPPMYVQVGEAEILYDDAVRLTDSARKAGVAVTFEPWRHMIHVWPIFVGAGIPESSTAIERMAAFLRGHMNLGML